jgi:iron(III) transport system substrate-binding protein
MAGIAYNPSTVADADAPKSWKELLEDKWNGEVTFKGANSGMQHLGWYEVRKLYGDAYWQHFEKYKARAFDSMVQQYERIANGKDKIAGGAQYSGFLSVKAKGAPVTFVVPTEGMPAGPEVWGVVEGGPHPQAGRLFLDWFLSQPGQSVMAKAFGLHSVRADVDPPPGGIALADMKLLLPDDWHDFLQSKVEFNREWKMITGQ